MLSLGIRMWTQLIIGAGMFVVVMGSNDTHAHSDEVILYKSGLHSIVHATVPTMEVAKDLAHDILEKELVACVNLIPDVTSFYKWKGEINVDSEIWMIIKTRSSRVHELTNYMRHRHPYDMSEIISTKIDDGNNKYLDWISKSVPEKSEKKIKY